MRKQLALVLAAAMLLGGTLGASATDAQSKGGNMSPPAKDSLNLTADQQRTAWNDLSSEAKKQNAPPSFFRAVGNVVSSSVKLQRFARLPKALHVHDMADPARRRIPYAETVASALKEKMVVGIQIIGL
jgi:hypothetical protein